MLLIPNNLYHAYSQSGPDGIVLIKINQSGLYILYNPFIQVVRNQSEIL